MVIYNLVIWLYGLLIQISSIKKLKAKQWVAGRKDWRKNYSKKISSLTNKKNIWIHCASYGEFEQGRPLIEAIKNKYSSYNIILTFFSPSGYEAFKGWTGAEAIFYLPLDTKSNAGDFINIVNPHCVIFIKYEFWLNFLFELKKQNIQTYLVSAVFKPRHPFFKWYGGIFKKSLKTFNKIFIQDDNSGELLKSINVKNYEIFGDTRFDRVMEVKSNFKPISYFERFCKDSKIIIAGSTWPKDNELLIEVFKKIKEQGVKLIIVPHEVDQKSVNDLVYLINKNELTCQLYSKQNTDTVNQILIVDVMGLLSQIYYYADVAYIGGGFNEGIHNCLEPAVYYKPILFYGEGYNKFNEAVDLINMKVALNITSVEETISGLDNFLNLKNKKQLEDKLENYFQQKSGTTKRVLTALNLN
jgi:3-deoxy-D-manno-octulosonic-acid transferase